METIWKLGVELVLWLQGLGSWLIGPMQLFSFLGNEYFFLFFAPIVYWCLDAATGLRVATLLMLSNGLNYAVKLAFTAPRPFWFDQRVHPLLRETSFGLPSNHAQTAVVVWGLLATVLRRAWFWVLAIFLIVMIGVSRVYVGVHFPTDVLAGWLIGALALWAFLKLERPVAAWLAKQTPGGQILAALGASLAILLVGAVVKLALGAWTLPAAWGFFAAEDFPGAGPLDPLEFSGQVTNAGALFGIGLGAVLLRQAGGFNTAGPLWQRLARFVLGAAGVAALYFGLGAVFPRGEYLLSYVLRFLRYTLITFWCIGLAPLVFVRLGWAKAGQGRLVREPAGQAS